MLHLCPFVYIQLLFVTFTYLILTIIYSLQYEVNIQYIYVETIERILAVYQHTASGNGLKPQKSANISSSQLVYNGEFEGVTVAAKYASKIARPNRDGGALLYTQTTKQPYLV